MKLRSEDCANFYSHFPVPNSLTAQELIAVLALSEEQGVAYFIGTHHAVTEEFGTHERHITAQTAHQYAGELLLEAN